MNSQPLVRVSNLCKHFSVSRGVIFSHQVGVVKAVDGVTFSIQHGETLGLVGESGCGKTTLGRAILRLIPKTSGNVYFEQKNLGDLDQAALAAMRRKMQIIFQDPYASLNPRLTVGEAIAEPLMAHGMANRAEARERALELLRVVGLADFHYNRYPHEFSGGQRQRVVIARTLVLSPEFVVADEPVSALDVSIQAQIIALLESIKKRFGLSFLFISHDLGVVRYLCDRVAVMYLGRLTELADSKNLFKSPKHPYTQALLAAVPSIMKRGSDDRTVLKGDVPSPLNPPTGCRFHSRCPQSFGPCSEIEPTWNQIDKNHYVACHLYQ